MPALYLTQNLGHRAKWPRAIVTGSVHLHTHTHTRIRERRGQNWICTRTDSMHQTVTDKSSSSVSIPLCYLCLWPVGPSFFELKFGWRQTQDEETTALKLLTLPDHSFSDICKHVERSPEKLCLIIPCSCHASSKTSGPSQPTASLFQLLKNKTWLQDNMSSHRLLGWWIIKEGEETFSNVGVIYCDTRNMPKVTVTSCLQWSVCSCTGGQRPSPVCPTSAALPSHNKQ